MKKLISIILSVCLIATMLVSCGSKDKNVLVVGTNAQFPPFESIGSDGYEGFDIDLIGAIAAKMGKKVEIMDMEFDGLLPALASHKVDLVIAGMSITPDREKNVDFAAPYYEASQVVLVAEGERAQYKSLSDLKGKRIGVAVGFVGESIASEELPGENIKAFLTGFELIKELANGRLDAVIFDNAPAKSFIKSQGSIEIAEGIAFDADSYGIALPKGSDELKAAINKAFAELVADGSYDALLKKHINK